jgi:hypothetical protein
MILMSLIYSGRKNNYIIKSFLNDEKKITVFLKHHQLEPEAFAAHLVKQELRN